MGKQSMSLPESYLPPEFFARPAEAVARDLIGKGLYVRHSANHLLCEITEVEAYTMDDEASHAFNGLTKRNWAMFEAGGACYVYQIYGMHLCMNIVTGGKGDGQAVLLRAATPIKGITWIKKRRHLQRASRVPQTHKLLSGPGNLAQGLGITMAHNGLTFFGDTLRVVDLGNTVPPEKISLSKRIGITKAAHLLRRYCLAGAPSLSRRG